MTIHAAIVPGSWTALVIASDDAGPLRPLIVESFEVGAVRQNPETARFSREMTDVEIQAAVTRVVQPILNARATAVYIEWARGKAAKSHPLTEAIRSALQASGIEPRVMHKWRLASGGAHHEWAARRVAEGFAGWPEGTFSAARTAGAMMLEAIAPSRGGAPIADDGPAVPVHVSDETIGGNVAALPKFSADGIEECKPPWWMANKIDAGSGGSLPFSEPCADPASPVTNSEMLKTTINETIDRIKLHTVPPSLPLFPDSAVTAGLDPGSAHLSLAIAQGRALPIRHVYAHTFPVGERVPLAKPKIVTRFGKQVEITTRHSLNSDHVERLAAEVLAVLEAHHVSRLIVEHVDSAHIQTDRANAASSIATALIRTTWIETEIASRATAAGIVVERVSAATWRAAVAGRARRGGAGAELIPAAIARGIAGWPAVSDEHERDAAGLCLYPAIMAAREVASRAGVAAHPTRAGLAASIAAAKKPRTRKPTTGKDRSKELEAGRAKRAAARIAAGCTCAVADTGTRALGWGGRGRHRKGCPLAGEAARRKAVKAAAIAEQTLETERNEADQSAEKGE
jgi:hypothetical protein